MKRSLKIWLSTLAVLCGTVPAWAGQPGQEPYDADAGVTTFVGDLTDTLVQEARPVRKLTKTLVSKPTKAAVVGTSKPVAPATRSAAPAKRPAKAPLSSQIMKVAHHETTSGSCNSGCDSACDACYDDGCDSMGGGGGRSNPLMGFLKSSSMRPKSGSWGRIETLLWWTQDRDSPALITTAPTANPPTPQSQATTLFGNPISSDLLVGNRVDFGQYVGDDQFFGVGGRVFGIWNGDQSESVVSDANGSPSIRIPFNDAIGFIGVPSSSAFFSLAQNENGVLLTGAASVNNEFDFIGTELYTRTLLGRGCDHRLDLIGGYSFHSIDDSIELSGYSTRFNAGNPLNTFFFTDAYEAQNTFHGGQIGFESQVVKGRFMFSSLTKLHLGNMNQRLRVNGASRIDAGAPGALGANQFTSTTNRGLLVQGNDGFAERDSFVFAPEANIKLGFRANESTTFTVGYSFIMWSDVVRAGDNIDTRLDATRISNDFALQIPVPVTPFYTDSFYMHGLDLGMTFIY